MANRKSPNRAGRPSMELIEHLESRREDIERMAMVGLPISDIALVVGCNENRLRLKFAEEIARGRAQGDASIRKKQFDIAMEGNVQMLIHLGKTRLGQKDELVVSTPNITELDVSTVDLLTFVKDIDES